MKSFRCFARECSAVGDLSRLPPAQYYGRSFGVGFIRAFSDENSFARLDVVELLPRSNFLPSRRLIGLGCWFIGGTQQGARADAEQKR